MALEYVRAPVTPPVAQPADVFVDSPLGPSAAAALTDLFERTDAYSIESVGVDNTYAPRRGDETYSSKPAEIGGDTVFQVRVVIDGGTNPLVRFEPGAEVCHIYTTMGDRGVTNSDSARHRVRQLHEVYLVRDVFQALDAVVAGERPRYWHGPTGHPLDSTTWPRAGFVEVYSPEIVAGRSLEELAVPGTTALRRLPDGGVLQLGRFDGKTDRRGTGIGEVGWFETDWVELPTDRPPAPHTGRSQQADGHPLVDDPAGVLRYVGSWDFHAARRLINATSSQALRHGDMEALAWLLLDDRLQVRREAAWMVTRHTASRYFPILGYLEEEGHPEVQQAIRDARRTKTADELRTGR